MVDGVVFGGGGGGRGALGVQWTASNFHKNSRFDGSHSHHVPLCSNKISQPLDHLPASQLFAR